jgi:TonB-dependent receptor
MADRLNVRRRMGATASWTVLGLALIWSGQALAQTTPPASGQEAPGGDPEITSSDGAATEVQDEDAIVVVGSRASQQSSIARKRNARTATDSIVADDIGSFPDRNVNEAISRVPGVALDRNEFGEGAGVVIRGSGPNLTRVELDGVGVQAADPALGTGRGADMRELPAELIKSVDIVKGATADMTEGSLSGSVQIKTRTGLDFKKPYFSLRAGAQQNSLSQDWRPDFSGVAASKFFDDRVGVIVNGNYSRVQNSSSNYENVTSTNRGYARFYDFDNSAEKTFTFNPDTVGTDAADIGFANSSQADGSLLTPRELVTLSAGASSKAQCLTIFPDNPTGTADQRAQRINEQKTCLNQWNDYTPSLIRHLMKDQDEKRYSFDARLDFQVTDNLLVYVKGTIANREVDDQFRTRTPATLFAANVAGTFSDTTTGYPRQRTLSPNAPAGYFRYPGSRYNYAGNNAFEGVILNVDPASVVVDDQHNVTKMTLYNNAVGLDQIDNKIDSKSKYAMAGAEWRNERLLVEAFGGYTKTSSSRIDYRTGRSYTYGTATMTLQENGLWDFELPANYDESNPANYVQLNPATCLPASAVPGNSTNPATCVGQAATAPTFANPGGTTQYLVSQMPLLSNAFSVQYSPRAGEQTEKIAKLDLTFDTDGLVPFIKRVKVGAMYRDNSIIQWSGGGRIISAAVGTYGQPGYVAPVVTPRALIRGSVRACQPTAGSSAPGGQSCNYGFTPSPNPELAREGIDTLTPQQLQDLLASSLRPQSAGFFRDLPNRGNLPEAWLEMDVEKFYEGLGAKQFMNFDCLKVCTGTDGKEYEQPFSGSDETIKNVYAMVDFEQGLPLDTRLTGNVGIRGVFTTRTGSGFQTIILTQPGPNFNPANPTAPAGLFNQTFVSVVDITKSTRDWLPSFNVALWGFNDTVVLRGYGSKTVAQPTVANLIPGGTCTVNEVSLDADAGSTFGCTGRIGNPGLSAFTAWNYNASLEWYPNADTMFSVAYGKLDVKIGEPIAVSVTGNPFGGAGTDAVTGLPLDQLNFNYPTWADGPGYKRNIWEFSAKHAFTYLPWFFRNLGIDANASILDSVATSGTRDPETGDIMPPAGQSRNYTNASLWYDDGKLNIRVAYQKRSESFACITPCGGNNIDYNYPGEQYTNVRLSGGDTSLGAGYNPGIPKFIGGSTYIDAKISYNINRNFQVYLEGRNMTREAQVEGAGKYNQFADGTERVSQIRYGGRRILTGVRVQFGN